MNNLILILITLVAMFIVGYGLPFLNKKGVKVEEDLNKVEKVVDGASAAITVASEVLPNNQVIQFLKNLKGYAQVAVHSAEQLYLISQLSGDERNAKAKESIEAMLKTLGIEKTPELNTIINDVVEAEVLALGHKDDSSKAIQVQLQAENAQLKQTIANIQNTIDTVQ